MDLERLKKIEQIVKERRLAEQNPPVETPPSRSSLEATAEPPHPASPTRGEEIKGAGGEGGAEAQKPADVKVEPKWNEQKLRDVFERLSYLKQKQLDADSPEQFDSLENEIHSFGQHIPSSDEIEEKDRALYIELSAQYAELASKAVRPKPAEPPPEPKSATPEPTPEYKESVFNGNIKVVEGLQKKFFADFKKSVLEGGTGPEAEEKIREAVGDHFYALVTGDIEGYLKLLETAAPHRGNKRIINLLIRDNIPRLLEKIMRRYGTTSERLREKLGSAFSDLYFDRVLETPPPEPETPHLTSPTRGEEIKGAGEGIGGTGGEGKAKKRFFKGLFRKEASKPTSTKQPEADSEEQEKQELERRKFEADPLRKLADSHGINIKQGELKYQFIMAEDIGKEKARIVEFENYTDYRAYLDTLSPYQRGIALRYEGVGIWANKVVWEQRDKLGEKDLEQFHAFEEKIRLGYAADEYGNKPEVSPKTEEEVKTLKDRFYNEFGISLHSDFRVGSDANYHAFQKLEAVLRGLSPEDAKNFSSFEPNEQNSVLESGGIAFNPDASVEQIAEWMKEEVLPEVRADDEKRQEAREILRRLEPESDNMIQASSLSFLSGKKSLQGAQSLEVALKDMPKPKTRIKIWIGEQTISARDEIDFKWDMSPEEMKTAILEYLKTNQK